MMSSNQPSELPSTSPSPSAGTHEHLYPPEMVPLGLNHLGDVLPGHYSSGQIPFLAPPPGVYTVPVMATLSLPNLTLGIPVWYHDPPAATPPGHPKPYIALTPVQPVPMTSPAATVPQSPQEEPPPVVITSGKKGKARKGASKDKAAPTNPAPPRPPKHTI